MGRRPKYDWDSMLDGQTWRFPIEDLKDISDVSVDSFRYTARQAAKRRGWTGVSVTVVGPNDAYIQVKATGPVPPLIQQAREDAEIMASEGA